MITAEPSIEYSVQISSRYSSEVQRHQYEYAPRRYKIIGITAIEINKHAKDSAFQDHCTSLYRLRYALPNYHSVLTPRRLALQLKSLSPCSRGSLHRYKHICQIFGINTYCHAPECQCATTAGPACNSWVWFVELSHIGLRMILNRAFLVKRHNRHWWMSFITHNIVHVCLSVELVISIRSR